MATELEILERAESYLRKLSLGINPITDEPLNENDSSSQERIQKCLHFVADYLSNDIARKKRRQARRGEKQLISIPVEFAEKYELFNEPVSISKIVGRLNTLLPKEMSHFLYQDIAGFLTMDGVLSPVETPSGRVTNLPTDFGIKVGFIKSVSTFNNVEHERTLCSRLGQQYILGNIQKCIEIANERIQKKNDAHKSNLSFERKKESIPLKISEDLFNRYLQDGSPLTISNIASKLKILSQDEENHPKISYKEIRDWFTQEGFLSKTLSLDGKESYTPTEKGSNCGIYIDDRVSSNGNTYQVLMYSIEAQKEFLKSRKTGG